MNNSAFTLALTGLVPAVCDAEAGEADSQSTDAPLGESASECGLADQSHRPPFTNYEVQAYDSGKL